METNEKIDSIYKNMNEYIMTEYVNKCAQASVKSRYVLIILIITSILTFIACWISRQSCWLNLRFFQTTEAYNLKVWKPYSHDTRDSVKEKRYRNAKLFADLRGINDSITLQDILISLQRQKQEKINDINIECNWLTPF